MYDEINVSDTQTLCYDHIKRRVSSLNFEYHDIKHRSKDPIEPVKKKPIRNHYRNIAAAELRKIIFDVCKFALILPTVNDLIFDWPFEPG